jgi:GTP cyclohydrolase I
MCMTMRGVEKPGAATRTSAFLGVFDSDRDKRMEFLAQIPSRSSVGGR